MFDVHANASIAIALAAAAALQASGAPARGQGPDWAALDRVMGRAAAVLPGGVHKFSFPRTDLHVVVGATAVRPALALGSWVAFKAVAGGKVLAMGDLVLLEREVAPVMQALQSAGIEQTALHNHLIGESPRVMYMHIMATGDGPAVARGIHDALAASRTPLGTPAPAAATPSLPFDTAAVAAALGVAGKSAGGVYQVSVPRPEEIREEGEVIPPAMGVATGINLQPTTGGRAVATGDFVLLPSEVNPVIRALRAHGITVTALHSHLMTEAPHVLFMHFWGDDDAVALARGLRAALDATAMGVRR